MLARITLHSKTITNSVHTLGIIENIDIFKIKSSKFPIRDDVGDLKQLILSIEEKGLLQPIVVRIIEDKFEIVAGNRRFLACKSIGWKKIPCYVTELSDEESFEVALVENVQRKTMNAIEEAQAYEYYIRHNGWGGESDLARRIGKSQEYVSKRLKLLELPQVIQEEIIRRRIKPSMGEEIAYIKNEKKQTELAKLIINRHVTIKKLRESLKNNSTQQNNDFFCTKSRENKNSTSIFDKTNIILKISAKRISELFEFTENDFLVHEFLLRQKHIIDEQINHTIRLKKKCAKLNIKFETMV